jgi:putative addiction module antidote
VNDTPRDAEFEGHMLQIKKIGNSLGLILPRDLLARLKLTEGDRLHVVELTERGIRLTPYDPKHAEGMALARRSFRRYADAYRALAK